MSFSDMSRHAELAKHLAWSGCAVGPGDREVRARSFETEVSQDDAVADWNVGRDPNASEQR